MTFKFYLHKSGLIDVTGVPLVPGNGGVSCPGAYLSVDKYGIIRELCCEECPYYICCMEPVILTHCIACHESNCPHFQEALQEIVLTGEGKQT